MQMAVTNASGRTIAVPDTHTTVPAGVADAPIFVTATGGNVVDPLPFPFTWVRSLANSAAKTFAINPRDLQRPPWGTHAPAQEWNDLVKAGVVTIALTDVATDTDLENTMASTAA